MKYFILLLLIFGFGFLASAQSCNPGGPAGSFDFFTTCETGTSFSGTDYTITVGNNKTVILNGDMTLTGTLTVNLTGSTSMLIVASSSTLTTTNIVFSGSATGKVIEVGGVVNVSGTLNFGGLDIELDGEGTLDVENIIGADNVSCTNGVNGGTGTCPTIDAGTCDDGTGSFCDDDPALPIELGSFTATLSEASILLNWTTLTEVNNDYFSIEKSLNGLDYELLTTVSGAGNSTEVLSYSYEDKSPTFGRSYYRLKQTDFDGASETFTPVPVDFTSLQNGKLSFTNPVQVGNSVTIYSTSSNDERLTLNVFSMLGTQILSTEFIGSEYEFEIDRNVRPGIYFVRVSSVSTEQTGRLVIQ